MHLGGVAVVSGAAQAAMVGREVIHKDNQKIRTYTYIYIYNIYIIYII